MSSKDDDTWFVIKDFDRFVESARSLVFNNFGKSEKEDTDIIDFAISSEEKEEIDRILSFHESEVICKELLKKQKNKKNNSVRHLVNDTLFLSIIESLNDRMISNILSGLVNKGLVDTAYDSESNDFVFWVKEDDTKKPETN